MTFTPQQLAFTVERLQDSHQLTATGLKLRRAGDAIVEKVIDKSFGSFTPKQVEQLGALPSQALENALR